MITIKQLGLTRYEPTWQAMRYFNAHCHEQVGDELWVTEHYPVFTLGLAGKTNHLHQPEPPIIPIIACDRGGQVTYHAPGQAVVYTMIDLSRRKLGVRALVELLEQAAINVLAQQGLCGERQKGKPGVYYQQKKIAALGLRIRKGRCYHGLSLNVALPLTPFLWINPCGYPEMEVTDIATSLPLGHATQGNFTDIKYWGTKIAHEVCHLLEEPFQQSETSLMH